MLAALKRSLLTKRQLLNFSHRHHRVFFGVSRFMATLTTPFRVPAPKTDLVFVVPKQQSGWILEAIAREIACRFRGTSGVHNRLTGLPAAKAYFFVHYSSLPVAFKLNPALWHRKVFVWYTHPRDDFGIGEEELLFVLGRSTRIFCTCTAFVSLLRGKGISAERLSCVLGGADPSLFLPHKRRSGKVGFSTAFYARKAPERILEIVRRMPHRRFLLVGRGWQQYERFEELSALLNFEYVEAAYQDYPALYEQMDVFVSPALLEGGPIPLIEAMMANVVPVASRTGFAPDLIRHGENGYLFDTDAPTELVCDLIERAFLLEADIRSTVLDYSWDRFAENVLSLMGFEKDAVSAPVSGRQAQGVEG
jgi:glycosyltransferase involved in cell wall biosynthesis